MTKPILKIQNLKKTFNKGTAVEHVALAGVDLELEDGDFVCIVGSNGAGKSSLFNCIAGSVMPDSGRIELDGRDITFVRDFKRARVLSRVFQDPLLGTTPNLTIAENIALALGRSTHQNPLSFALSSQKIAYIKEILSKFNVGLEDRLDTKVGTLSGGQRQTVCLLMAVIGKPKLLLLDEHTAALDPQATKKVMDLTREAISLNNTTTLMITHNMEEALENGNKTVVMHEGKIVAKVKGNERKDMKVEDLLELFQVNTGEFLTDDKILLS